MEAGAEPDPAAQTASPPTGGSGDAHWSIRARRTRYLEIERSPTGFKATGHDPHIVFDLEQRQEPGWYLCEIELGRELSSVSRLYVDLGGFSSDSGFVFRSVGGGVRRIVFRSPRRFRRLRIDPSEERGPFSIENVRLVPILADSLAGPVSKLSSGLEVLMDPTSAVVPRTDTRERVHTPSPVPGTVAAARGFELSGSAYRATQPRARLSVVLDRPLKRGWYSIVVGTEEASNAEISLQFGFRGGLFNLSRIVLDRTAEGLFTTWVFLPARVGRIRLNAAGDPQRLSITRVEAIATNEPWGSVSRRRTRSGILVVDAAAQEAARRPPWGMPGRLAEVRDIVATPSGHRALSYEARFRLAFDRPVRKGWYRISARVATDPSVRPRIRLDFGDGPSAPIRLARATPPEFSAFCRIPRPLAALDFEPVDHPTAFVVDTLMMRRVPFHEVVNTAVAAGYRHYRKDRKRFRRFVADALGSLVDTRKVETFSSASSLYHGEHSADDRYSHWIAVVDFDNHRHGDALRSRLAEIADPPRFSIVVPIATAEPIALAEAIEAIRVQIWEHWELLLAVDADAGEAVTAICDGAAASDPRISVRKVPAGAGISAAANMALAAATGTHLIVLGDGDRLRAQGLAELAIAASEDPAAEILYADEDTLTARGGRTDPHFKPAWSEDMFHAWNYLGRPVALKLDRVRSVGGFRRAVEAAQEYDLILRIVDQVGPEAIRHLPKILCHRVEGRRPERIEATRGEAVAAARQALEEHLERRRIAATVELRSDFPSFRVKRAIVGDIPGVTIIVPTRDRPDLLRPFLHTLFEVTDYPSFHLTLVDNGTVDPEALELLSTYGLRPDVTVIRDEQPFNYSRLNNRAAALADTPLIALLNNDIRFNDPEWLRELASQAIRPEVGAVGAKLFYPDGRIQHAGVGLGIGTSGVAGHTHHLFPGESTGYFGRLATIQDYSAVTAAAVMLRRAVFQEVGGLDEKNLTVAYNDIDLCLKVRRAGYRVLWTPFARMFHYESASRGQDLSPAKRARYEQEIAYMREAWGQTLLSDPFYSPNFDRARSDFMPGGG